LFAAAARSHQLYISRPRKRRPRHGRAVICARGNHKNLHLDALISAPAASCKTGGAGGGASASLLDGRVAASSAVISPPDVAAAAAPRFRRDIKLELKLYLRSVSWSEGDFRDRPRRRRRRECRRRRRRRGRGRRANHSAAAAAAVTRPKGVEIDFFDLLSTSRCLAAAVLPARVRRFTELLT